MIAVLEPERPAKRRLEDDDEDLGDLPPLDGGDDEAEAPLEELDDAPPEIEAGDPFDDATGEGDPLDELLPDEGETGWLDDAADEGELDVGAHDIDEEERGGLLDDADEVGVGDEDFGLHESESSLTADAGEEGPTDDDDELREEDLPRLDADADGEGDDAEFTDAWPSTDDERPPWDDRAWERASDVPRVGLARSVVVVEGGILAAGARLARIEARGAIPIEDPMIHGKQILGVATLASGLAVLTDHGLVVRDDEERGREANGWQERGEGPGADVVARGQRVWVRTRSGALAESVDRGRRWEVLATSGVRAVGADGDGLVVLVEGPGGTSIVARGPARTPWSEPLPPSPAGFCPIVRARGDAVVVAWVPQDASRRSLDPGAGAFRAVRNGSWERLAGLSGVTALALLDDVGTVLGAVYGRAEDRAWIVRVGADNLARIVAELGGDTDEGEEPRVLDLAWDDAAKIAWAVGPFGVAALRPR